MSWLEPTVTASTMITDLNGERKVRCHNGLVEILTTFHAAQSQPLLGTKKWNGQPVPFICPRTTLRKCLAFPPAEE
jgi:hypothetical protein